ncbi:MAG: FAD-dependent oxidoreductase [Alphaproteobacteria bacterium]|nr:FAD-dependent oxidoreductase [Alphaproteobacteria bacterium]
MTTTFKHLFQPLRLRHMTLKNRLNFGAHTANMSVEGLPQDRHLGYYLERSIGGAAMIVVEPSPVHKATRLTRGNFLAEDDAVIPGFRRITDACHANETVMIHQMYHLGAHGDWDNALDANWSPSGLPSMHDSDGSHAMTAAEIEILIGCFAQAARRDKEAGFDGSELMGGYGALLEQFWSAHTNRRDDQWGGGFENRMRFPTAVLAGIRKTVGEDFIVGLCLSVDPTRPDFLSLADQQEVAAYLDARGLVDYITVGTGSYYDFTRIMPTVVYEDKLGPPFAEAIKAVVRHAKVQAESHIRTPENADAVIGAGQADMVSIVRGQIADPHMANKARDGRAADVRPCLSCNQMCWGRRSRDYHISCLVNPSAGREFEWGGDRFTRAAAPRHVLVVGGGPAGLETARVAAERGHRVTLVEAADRLGGQFRLAGQQPRRAQILDLLAWYERQLEQLQVQILRNRYLDAEAVRASGADVVVLAAGSLPSGAGYQRGLPTRDRMPGVEGPNVWSAEDVMGKAARLGPNVLVLDDGGNWKGVGTAWHLAERGHRVTIVTPDPYVGREMTRTAADLPVRERLRKAGATFIVESAVVEWHGDGATIRDLMDGSERRLPFDGLVLATTNVATTELALALAGSGLEMHVIGDGLSPRHAAAAILDGRRLGLGI